MPRGRAEVDDLHRERAGRCDRGVRCAARRPTASTAGRTARGGGRTRSCGPSPPRLGGHEQARAAGLAEPRHLDVAARRRQLLVKDAGGELGAMAERGPQHLQRLAVRDEHQRLLARVAPPRRLRQQPLDARVRRRPWPAPAARSARFVGAEHGRQRGARRERAADAVDLLLARHGVRRRRRRARRLRPPREGASAPGSSIVTGTPTRGGSPPMSTRRVELVHGGSGVPDASRASKPTSSGNSSGRSSCSSRKKPCASSSSGVALSSSTWRPSAAIGATARHAGSPGCPGGRRRRCASSTTSRSMPARDRLRGELRIGRQRLERDDRAAMQLERVEAGAEVALHVGEPPLVEQREHLVILAPQLAEPLHGERGRRHHEAALDAARVHEAVEDQAGLDGLAEAHFVGQQPAHRVAGGGALGDVQLVREQPDAAAEERAEPVGLAHARAGAGCRDGSGSRRASSSSPAASRSSSDRSSAGAPVAGVHRHQRVRVGRQAQRRAGARKLDDERAPVDGRDAADAEFGIETVREMVARSPGLGPRVGHRPAARDHSDPAPRSRAYLTAPGAPPLALNSWRLMMPSPFVS